MDNTNPPIDCLKSIIKHEKLLIIQDIDGVCIPLVKDPLTRKIDHNYIYSAQKLKGEFFVLTCGEHEGKRGVNRIIENSIHPNINPSKEGLYLPGLAACGVEYQDSYGNITLLGLSEEEINFLQKMPSRMKSLLIDKLTILLPDTSKAKINELARVAICDTRFTPTLNLNEILAIAKNNISLQLKLQSMMLEVMNELLETAIDENLKESFYLHMMPNLGVTNNKEIMKYAKEDDIGTTDIQFILNGALKEAGLLVLLNKYIKLETGKAPFGESFNVRNAPKSSSELIDLCLEKIPSDIMPTLIGVGDTITSNWCDSNNTWLRGGSDRGFLTLIYKLGEKYNKENKIIFVNSSNEEVKRPYITPSSMKGVSDADDILKFDAIMSGGPNEYVQWFHKLAEMRSSIRYELSNI